MLILKNMEVLLETAADSLLGVQEGYSARKPKFLQSLEVESVGGPRLLFM